MTVNSSASNTSKIISFVTSKGFQIHPDALSLIEKLHENMFHLVEEILMEKKKKNNSTVILSDDIEKVIKYSSISTSSLKEKSSINSSFIVTNKNIHININIHDTHNKRKDESQNVLLNTSSTFELNKTDNHIIYDSNNSINSSEGVEGYTSLFKSRFEKSLKILSNRPDSKRIKKIGFIKQLFNKTQTNPNASSKENLENSIIIAGLLMDKKIRKNGYSIAIDDQTGLLEATAYNEDLRKQISLLALDQMVMVELDNSKHRNYVIKNLFSLDIPDRITNRSNTESYAVLISDLHIGSKFFMENEFQNFLTWLNGNDENKDIVSKIKYICICGDLIDGIGIFPHQDRELLEKDSYSQMEHATNILSKIPKHMKVFLIPGNHDLGRRALPQPAIPKKYASEIYSLGNITMLGNPCMINMNGVRILMYHGQSLDDTIATIPGLSYAKPAEAMKILLKARHLSPIYGQRTPIAPEIEDMMVIEEIPDIFHSGHVHVIDVDSYKGTLIANSGAWQTQTPFQRAMGITPTPAIALVVNLSTLKPYQINFSYYS